MPLFSCASSEPWLGALVLGYGPFFIERNFTAAVETPFNLLSNTRLFLKNKSKALAKMLAENDYTNCILNINISSYERLVRNKHKEFLK